jgi:hypothetical protein
LDISVIVHACHSPKETSATHILEEVEACQLRRLREAQATILSLTDKEFALTTTRDYGKVVQAIKRVLNAAPSTTGPQHQSLCQGLYISPTAWQAVTQSAIQFQLPIQTISFVNNTIIIPSSTQNEDLPSHCRKGSPAQNEASRQVDGHKQDGTTAP